MTEPAIAALAAGVEALVTKAARPEDLLAPVLAVLQGWRVLSPSLLDGLLAKARRPGSEVLADIDDESLTLWLLVAEGLELSRIAERLYVSERTAKRMVADLRDRLGANTRIEMRVTPGTLRRAGGSRSISERRNSAGPSAALESSWPPRQ